MRSSLSSCRRRDGQEAAAHASLEAEDLKKRLRSTEVVRSGCCVLDMLFGGSMTYPGPRCCEEKAAREADDLQEKLRKMLTSFSQALVSFVPFLRLRPQHALRECQLR